MNIIQSTDYATCGHDDDLRADQITIDQFCGRSALSVDDRIAMLWLRRRNRVQVQLRFNVSENESRVA